MIHEINCNGNSKNSENVGGMSSVSFFVKKSMPCDVGFFRLVFRRCFLDRETMSSKKSPIYRSVFGVFLKKDPINFRDSETIIDIYPVSYLCLMSFTHETHSVRQQYKQMSQVSGLYIGVFFLTMYFSAIFSPPIALLRKNGVLRHGLTIRRILRHDKKGDAL